MKVVPAAAPVDTWNTCPVCHHSWTDRVAAPGVVHRTTRCAACRRVPRSDDTRRARVAAAVEELAVRLDRGEVCPMIVELHALALICDELVLPLEAARVRRWILHGSSS